MNKWLKAITPEHGNDISRLKAAIPILNRFSDIEADLIWRAFSLDLCAGFLTVNNETIKAFKEWSDIDTEVV